MGIIRAALGATRATLRNQYKDLIVCETLTKDWLVKRGQKENDSFSSNKGQDHIITDGSVVIVGTGQCALIVEQGKIIDFCAEPGEYIWDSKASPSMLNSGFDGLKGAFSTVMKRASAGGNSLVRQSVYYVNMMKIPGRKFGKGEIPFRDAEFGFTMKVGVHGQFSYQITNPVFFFEQYVGTRDKDFPSKEMDELLWHAVVQAVEPAFARLSAARVTYDQIGADMRAVTGAIREELKEEWEELKGITAVNVNISTTVDSASQERMSKLQEARILSNPGMAAGFMTGATAEAMNSAASNENGAMMGFMGMGMAQQQGGNMVNGLHAAAGGQVDPYQQQAQQQQQPQQPQQQQQPQQPDANSWTCACGHINSKKFCGECGTPQPEAKTGWTCSCGHANTGKFCGECGSKQVFVPDNKCQKCGFTGESNFKFCPECGGVNDR